MQVRGLFDANLSTIKKFTIDDALMGIDTLLLVLVVPRADKYALHALRYKIYNLRRLIKLVPMIEQPKLDR